MTLARDSQNIDRFFVLSTILNLHPCLTIYPLEHKAQAERYSDKTRGRLRSGSTTEGRVVLKEQ